MPSHALISVGTATGTAKDWDVPLTLTDVTGITAGRYMRIDPTEISGTGRWQELCGFWKVVSVVGNVVTIKHRHYASSFPVMTASGTIKRVTTFLRFPAGSRGIVVESGGHLENLHWGQAYDCSAAPGSDHPDDGLQVGSQADTTTTGLTQSVRHAGAVVFTRYCGVCEFPGNGTQVVNGSAHVGVGLMNCANGWRGHQAGELAYSYNHGGVSAANFASNDEVERGGSMTIPNGASFGGGSENLYALSGVAPLPWTVHGYGGSGQFMVQPFVFDGREVAQRRVAA